MKVTVNEYDITWKDVYKAESKVIKKSLQKNCFDIKHIGGTSVAGLASAPVIDMLVAVNKYDDTDVLDSAMTALGYSVSEIGEGYRIYLKNMEKHSFSVRLYDKMKRSELESYAAVRDYLRSNAEEVKAFSEAKKKWEEEYADSPEAYENAKAEYLAPLKERAAAWQKKMNKQGTCLSIGMCLGLSVGMSIGSLLGNTATGMCMGMAVGMCLGLVFGTSK